MKALIVEDDAGTRRAIEAAIQDFGGDPKTFNCGAVSPTPDPRSSKPEKAPPKKVRAASWRSATPRA